MAADPDQQNPLRGRACRRPFLTADGSGRARRVRLLLLHNPRAGGGRAGRLLPRIRAALQARGIATDVLAGQGPGEASSLLARQDLDGFDGVVAVGGDGTLFDLVNGLYARDPASRPPAGVIPVGTGNAFARDLGLSPGDWQGAVDLLAAGRTRRFDVGRVVTAGDTFHFVNVAGIGFVAEAGRAALRLKHCGGLAYTLAVLWCLLRLRSHSLLMEVDGREIRQQNVFVEVSNSRYTGARYLIAPAAVPDDGLFDVTLLRDLPRWRLLLLFPTVFRGRHVGHREVTVLRGQAIRLLEPEGLSLMADGEFRGATPAEIRCLHRDLEMFC
jgi:diacylglycerol kinase (ATP)